MVIRERWCSWSYAGTKTCVDVDVDVDVDDDMNAQSAVGTKKLSVGPVMQHLVHPINSFDVNCSGVFSKKTSVRR